MKRPPENSGGLFYIHIYYVLPPRCGYIWLLQAMCLFLRMDKKTDGVAYHKFCRLSIHEKSIYCFRVLRM